MCTRSYFQSFSVLVELWSFVVALARQAAVMKQVKRDNADCEIVLNEYTAGHEYDARYPALLSFKVK